MAGVTLLTACDNALNETDYTYSISSETFYNTVEEANAAVLAPLDAMRSAYNSNIQTIQWLCERNTYEPE